MKKNIYTFVLILGIIAGMCSCNNEATTLSSTTTSTSLVQEWTARYNWSENENDSPTAMVVDGDGNVYVTGSSSGGTATYEDYATVKYDSLGEQVWAVRYNSTGNGQDMPSALALDSQGNVYVTGFSKGIDSDYDYLTIKYDNDGNQVWEARYSGTGNGSDTASSLVIDSQDNIYVTGRSAGDNGEGCATIKYDTDGHQLWTAFYKSPGTGIDAATDMAVDAAGNVYIAGTTGGTLSGGTGSGSLETPTPAGTPNDYLTIKYDSEGNQQWVAVYDGPGQDNDFVHAVEADDDGNVYVSGESIGEGTLYDCATVKYDRDGNRIWVARYNGEDNRSEGVTAMALDGDGSIYVTGYASSIVDNSARDYLTIKYDSEGNRLWTARYSGVAEGDDIARALVPDDDGNVYVTGESGANYYTTGAREEYATIKYDSSGQEVWAVRYNNGEGSRNWAHALAVDAAGNVYVTGSSTTEDTEYDYLTIKYEQP